MGFLTVMNVAIDIYKIARQAQNLTINREKVAEMKKSVKGLPTMKK